MIEPSPLDAYETAKPLEPTWTVQGGDPLGAPLLRIWSVFARIQAGVISGGETDYVFRHILDAANKNPPENEKEKDGLLIRATETEKVSWRMDEYFRGQLDTEEQAAAKSFDEFEKLDIYDIRRRCATLISNFFSELNDYREELLKHKWLTPELDNQMQGAILSLRTISKQIGISK